MGIPHVAPAEVLNLRELRPGMPLDSTFALMKSDAHEVIRLVMPKGKEMPPHSVEGPCSLLCLSGRIQLTLPDRVLELRTADWLHLEGGAPHALEALEDSHLLLTILFTRAINAE